MNNPKTLHVSVKNRARISAFGKYHETWDQVISRILDIAESKMGGKV